MTVVTLPVPELVDADELSRRWQNVILARLAFDAQPSTQTGDALIAAQTIFNRGFLQSARDIRACERVIRNQLQLRIKGAA